MVERRISALVAVVAVFFVSAVLWDAFVRPPRSRPQPDAGAPSTPDTGRVRPDTAAPPRPAVDTSTMLGSQYAGDATGRTSYMVLLARAETRRRIRASAGLTYLNDIVAASVDSMLHRWDNRILDPVRVYLPAGRVANFQPSFLDAVRRAFQEWQDAGVPVRFKLDADSTSAEVRFQWRIQFEGERTGQTEVVWDPDGHITFGSVTLATFNPKGQPLGPDDMQVVAAHEIGHLIGLDHSPDSTDLMFTPTKVPQLSQRDIRTARLLYDLAPGSLR